MPYTNGVNLISDDHLVRLIGCAEYNNVLKRS